MYYVLRFEFEIHMNYTKIIVYPDEHLTILKKGLLLSIQRLLIKYPLKSLGEAINICVYVA